MRLRAWFNRERNGESPSEDQEKSGGRRGSRAQGRMKERWRRNSPEDRRQGDGERSVLDLGTPLSHGLF